MRQYLALMIVVGIATAAGGATITMTPAGAPDFSGSGGPVFDDLQRLIFNVAKDEGAADQINAASMTIVTTDGEDARIHQVFAKSFQTVLKAHWAGSLSG